MLLDEAKKACRVLSDDYDSEINRLIRAALADIDITDVDSALLDLDATAFMIATEDGRLLVADGGALATEDSTAKVFNEDGEITLLPLIKNAVILYCRIYCSYQPPEHVYRQLKEAYDEQKAQMLMSSTYTTWKRKYA